MFEDLYDAVSLTWSFAWPTAQGEITTVDVERIPHSEGGDTLRLAIAYKFSLGEDGPYTGESFWTSKFLNKKRVIEARHHFHIHQPVTVRYRRDDPSVNTLDRTTWRDL
jgi:hypothetical protein